MIVTQSLREFARNNPNVDLEIQKGMQGWYIYHTLGARPLEYFDVRSDCVRVLEENGYKKQGRNRWVKV